MNMRMRSRKRIEDKVPGRPSAARLARAAAEDRVDAEWGERWDRALQKFVDERGLTGFDVFLAIKDAPLPPPPAGYAQRREYCNRCGQRTEMNPDYDALYCGRCNRWIESKCGDPCCEFCSNRPECPMP